MEIVKMFDCDGVLFRNPEDVLFDVVKNEDKIIQETIYKHGGIPDHLLELDAGKRLYKKFSEEYFAQRMPECEIERLRQYIGTDNSLILSYNKKTAIEQLLLSSGINDLFDKVIAIDKSKGGTKEVVFEVFRYRGHREIVFFSDTVSDMFEAVNYVDPKNLFGVTDSEQQKEKLSKFTSNIISPFY